MLRTRIFLTTLFIAVLAKFASAQG